jgi:hypothetical protein
VIFRLLARFSSLKPKPVQEVKTLVWFSEIPWDFLVQRHHHLVENLSSDWKVFFIEPFSRYKFRIRHKQVHNVVAIPLPINGVLLEIPILGALLRRFNRLCLLGVIRWYGVRRNGLIIVSSNVFVGDLARTIGGVATVFDCHDHIASFPHLPASTQAYFDRTVRSADLVVCSSKSLYSLIKVQKRDACAYVGNGVSRTFIDTARSIDRLHQPQVLKALGFIGVLSEWVDFDLLEKIAERFPQTELLLVGPGIYRCRKQIDRLKSYPNISLVGNVPYQRLPYYLARMQVGLIPFKHSRLTYFVNPNKLYEYAAFGIQIVSTSFSPDVRQYADRIGIAENGAEFLSLVETALLKGDAVDPAVRKIAEANVWEQKAAAFARLLDGTSGSEEADSRLGLAVIPSGVQL